MEIFDHCLLCQSDRIVTIDEDCNIIRCKTCGFVFHSPRPTATELAQFYSTPAQSHDWLSNEQVRDEMWLRRLRKVHNYRTEGSLLDVSTGIGQFLHFARNMFFPVTGSEVSDSAIRIARQKYELTLEKGTINSIDWKNRKFDVITLFHVLNHELDPLELIFSCKKLLKPSGLLIITVPNDLSAFSAKLSSIFKTIGIGKLVKTEVGLHKIDLENPVSKIQLSYFNSKVLQICLQRCGFKIIETDLDPYYIASGFDRVMYSANYGLSRIVKKVFRTNIYDTIWLAAELPPNSPHE